MKNENFDYIKNMELKYCNSPVIKNKLNQNKIKKIDLFEENNNNNKNYFVKENIFFVNNNNNNQNENNHPYLNYINKEKDFIDNKNNNKKTILKLLLINSIKI